MARFSGSGRSLARMGAVLVISGTMVLSAFLGQSAFAQSASPSSSGGQTTFNFGDTSEPSSLNPLVGYLGTDYTFWAVNYDLLVNFNTKDFGPDFAHSITTSVDTNSDNTQFTYHLRPGIKWSDGKPFSANDVAWTLNFYKKNNISNYASDLTLMDNAKATDANTVVITSTKPTTLYSGDSVWFYEYILPEHIWGKYTNDPAAAKRLDNVPSVGTGPYIIKSYTQGQDVTLEKNPYYWGKSVGLNPHYDRIIYTIYNNEDAEAAGLNAGSLDFAYIDSANIFDQLKARSGITGHAAFPPSFDEVAMNTGSEYYPKAKGFTPHGTSSRALTDPQVRQAIRMAIDSQTLIDKVYGGYGQVQWTIVSPNSVPSGIYWPIPNPNPMAFNIQAANDKLDQAGYKMGSDGIRVDPKTNKPLEFLYYTRSSDQNTIDDAPYVKQWLGQIGIKINVKSVASNQLTNIIDAGNYDMFQWGWYPNPDPSSILAVLTCDERPPDGHTYGNNDAYFCNPEYDKLYEQQLTAKTVSDRTAIVQKMQQILFNDMPYAVIGRTPVLETYRTDSVTGFLPQPDNGQGDLLATYGPYSFISIRPASAGAGQVHTSGIPGWVWIAIVAAIVLIVVVIMVARGRKPSEERE
jgi:peptide/nickel transport system substrate-binding protein